jgi:hypothetical protein
LVTALFWQGTCVPSPSSSGHTAIPDVHDPARPCPGQVETRSRSRFDGHIVRTIKGLPGEKRAHNRAGPDARIPALSRVGGLIGKDAWPTSLSLPSGCDRKRSRVSASLRDCQRACRSFGFADPAGCAFRGYCFNNPGAPLRPPRAPWV